jgi:leader peptidase (prepilin peptidase)/N-methyltransferase
MRYLLYIASGWLAGSLINLYISRSHSRPDGVLPFISPVVKLCMSMATLLIIHRYGTGLYALKLVLLACILIAAAIIDLHSDIIPDFLTITGCVLGIALGSLEGANALIGYIIGLATGGGVLLIIALLSKGGIGGGDIKLMAVIGAFLGWRQALVALLLSFVFGGAVATLLVLSRKKGMKDMIPFGPFLGMSGIFTALYYQRIVLLYSGFCR